MAIRLRILRGLLLLGACCLPFVTALGQIAILSPLTHEFIVEQGQQYTGSITITNSSAGYVEVSVTQSDYLFFSDGSNLYADVGTVERSNARWISLSLPERVMLPPGETIDVPFVVEIPSDLSLIGTYWSMVLISPMLPPASDVDGPSIRQVMRYGIQMVTHIGDTGERRIEVLDARVTETEAGRTLEVDVENTGERWVRPSSWIEIYDVEGTLVGRIDGYSKRIYPGTSVRFRFDLPEDVESGAYTVLVVFDNAVDDANIWGMQIDLSF